MPHTVTSGAVRSYRTLSPLPALTRLGGFLSAALVVGLRRPGVTWHPALWSPDFPPFRNSQVKTERRLSGQLRGGFYAGYSLDTITIPKQMAVAEIVVNDKVDTTLVCQLREPFLVEKDSIVYVPP